jgi:hypothetical protein
MPALSVVLAGGDADLTDLPCSRSPDWAPVLRRRRPSAARSLLRNPPARASLTCGASSGRRLMAPASLPNYYEAACGTPEHWSSTPARTGLQRRQPIRGPYRCPTATPTTECRKPRQRPVSTGYRPCLSPRSRCNLQHRPDGTPVDVRSAGAGWKRRYRPSGVRAGTPDRRGKRGEVAAIFAMITTNPTRSIGEVGLGITSTIRPPS